MINEEMAEEELFVPNLAYGVKRNQKKIKSIKMTMNGWFFRQRNHNLMW